MPLRPGGASRSYANIGPGQGKFGGGGVGGTGRRESEPDGAGVGGGLNRDRPNPLSHSHHPSTLTLPLALAPSVPPTSPMYLAKAPNLASSPSLALPDPNDLLILPSQLAVTRPPPKGKPTKGLGEPTTRAPITRYHGSSLVSPPVISAGRARPGVPPTGLTEAERIRAAYLQLDAGVGPSAGGQTGEESGVPSVKKKKKKRRPPVDISLLPSDPAPTAPAPADAAPATRQEGTSSAGGAERLRRRRTRRSTLIGRPGEAGGLARGASMRRMNVWDEIPEPDPSDPSTSTLDPPPPPFPYPAPAPSSAAAGGGRTGISTIPEGESAGEASAPVVASTVPATPGEVLAVEEDDAPPYVSGTRDGTRSPPPDFEVAVGAGSRGGAPAVNSGVDSRPALSITTIPALQTDGTDSLPLTGPDLDANADASPPLSPDSPDDDALDATLSEQERGRRAERRVWEEERREGVGLEERVRRWVEREEGREGVGLGLGEVGVEVGHGVESGTDGEVESRAEQEKGQSQDLEEAKPQQPGQEQEQVVADIGPEVPVGPTGGIVDLTETEPLVEPKPIIAAPTPLVQSQEPPAPPPKDESPVRASTPIIRISTPPPPPRPTRSPARSLSSPTPSPITPTKTTRFEPLPVPISAPVPIPDSSPVIASPISRTSSSSSDHRASRSSKRLSRADKGKGKEVFYDAVDFDESWDRDTQAALALSLEEVSGDRDRVVGPKIGSTSVRSDLSDDGYPETSVPGTPGFAGSVGRGLDSPGFGGGWDSPAPPPRTLVGASASPLVPPAILRVRTEPGPAGRKLGELMVETGSLNEAGREGAEERERELGEALMLGKEPRSENVEHAEDEDDQKTPVKTKITTAPAAPTSPTPAPKSPTQPKSPTIVRSPDRGRFFEVLPEAGIIDLGTRPPSENVPTVIGVASVVESSTLTPESEGPMASRSYMPQPQRKPSNGPEVVRPLFGTRTSSNGVRNNPWSTSRVKKILGDAVDRIGQGKTVSPKVVQDATESATKEAKPISEPLPPVSAMVLPSQYVSTGQFAADSPSRAAAKARRDLLASQTYDPSIAESTPSRHPFNRSARPSAAQLARLNSSITAASGPPGRMRSNSGLTTENRGLSNDWVEIPMEWAEPEQSELLDSPSQETTGRVVHPLHVDIPSSESSLIAESKSPKGYTKPPSPWAILTQTPMGRRPPPPIPDKKSLASSFAQLQQTIFSARTPPEDVQIPVSKQPTALQSKPSNPYFSSKPEPSEASTESLADLESETSESGSSSSFSMSDAAPETPAPYRFYPPKGVPKAVLRPQGHKRNPLESELERQSERVKPKGPRMKPPAPPLPTRRPGESAKPLASATPATIKSAVPPMLPERKGAATPPTTAVLKELPAAVREQPPPVRVEATAAVRDPTPPPVKPAPAIKAPTPPPPSRPLQPEVDRDALPSQAGPSRQRSDPTIEAFLKAETTVKPPSPPMAKAPQTPPPAMEHLLPEIEVPKAPPPIFSKLILPSQLPPIPPYVPKMAELPKPNRLGIRPRQDDRPEQEMQSQLTLRVGKWRANTAPVDPETGKRRTKPPKIVPIPDVPPLAAPPMVLTTNGGSSAATPRSELPPLVGATQAATSHTHTPTTQPPLSRYTDVDLLAAQLEGTGAEYEGLHHIADFLGPEIARGASEAQLQTLIVGPVEIESRRVANDGKVKLKLVALGLRVTKCPICQAQFKNGEMIGLLECGHVGHERCVEGWLRRDLRCMVCRHPFC